jgi:predicted RNA-binding Zn ribbon-like protein
MMAVMTDQSAPGRLELIREFVNTLDVELATDALATPAAASGWLAEHSLGDDEPLTEIDAERLRTLREALRQLLDANNSGEPPSSAALDLLNEQATEAALGLRFDPAGSELVSSCGGVDSAVAALLAEVHEAMRDKTWARLKVCPADDCRWAFYDHSRNRSGTWCRMQECGNRAKARAYRERHR